MDHAGVGLMRERWIPHTPEQIVHAKAYQSQWRRKDRAKDPEKYRSKRRAWRQANLETSRAYDKAYIARRVAENPNYHHDAQLRRKTPGSESLKLLRRRARGEGLIHYGGPEPKCACCLESIERFLTFDHINNDGAKHRRENAYSDLAVWLRGNGWPDGYQVLCYNCNLGRAHNGGICPHKEVPT